MLRLEERHLAIETEDGAGLAERGVDADAAVEHEALTVVVCAAALFEIFQDAAVELMNVFKAGALHERPRLLAANAAGAEHHQGSLLEFLGQALHGVGEFPEVIDMRDDGAAKGAEADFVVVAGVEEGDGAALVEPLLERVRGEFGRRVAGGIDALDPEGDDLFFNLHEHPVVGLFGAETFFGGEVGEAGNGAKLGDEGIDLGAGAGDKEVDAFRAQENGAAQFAGVADRAEAFAQGGEFVERRELVGGDVDESGHGAVREGVDRRREGG